MFPHVSGLTDILMLEVSKYIPDYNELLDLGVRVLGMPNHQVKLAQAEFENSNVAGYELLQTWAKQQGSPQEAFRLLITRLKETNWNQLSHVLEQGAMPKPMPSGQSEKCT